jgi:uncharacterized protein YgbK (DUF1537 family)
MNTNTRDVPASEAEERIRALADRVGEDAELFKKVDSVFRGNTGVEICAAIRHWRFDLAVVAPAYPAMGRKVRDGVLRMEDASGESTVRVEESLAGCLLRKIAAGSEEEVATTMRAALADGTKAVLCDATEQSDLEQVVHAARSMQVRVLWIGSGGLAHALAAKSGSRPQIAERRRGQVAFFVGSQHAATGGQVERLRNVATADRASGIVVRVAIGTTEDEIRRSIGDVAAEQIGCLLMTGGDTALFVCRALGVESIRLEREFAAGVPLGTVEGGPLHGVTVALKSGGFGDANLMCRVLEEFGAKQEVTV